MSDMVRNLARSALTQAEAALDEAKHQEAIANVVRAVRLLDQAMDSRSPRLAQATTRELLQEVHRRCERDDMLSSMVRNKVSTLLGMLQEGSVLDLPDPYR